jgi:UDPglucose 6-dehydrogenase
VRIAVVGLGYAGLCTAACLSTKFKVTGIDVDEARVLRLKRGEAPIHEKGLPAMLKAGIAKGNLSFSTGYDSVRGADVIIIAVGTPSRPDGSIDLSQVIAASTMVAKQLALSKRKRVVVVKSTVTPGTTATVVRPILEKESGKKCGDEFGLCSNPEFLREGAAIEDMLHPDRIIIGPLDKDSRQTMKALYRRLYGRKSPPIVMTSAENAELIKYASNTFLATKISFINFIARLCETLPGADVEEVAHAMGMDPRIGGEYLQAGPGFGGACLPKDSRALGAFVLRQGLSSSLMRSVLDINDTQPGWISSEVEKALGGVRGREVALLGVAFKKDSDDVRESRAISLARILLDKGARVRITDPKAIEGAKRELGSSVSYFEDMRECIDGADAAVLMTAWNDFRKLKAGDFLKLMRTPFVFDAGRLYDPKDFRLPGLNFHAVGRGPAR